MTAMSAPPTGPVLNHNSAPVEEEDSRTLGYRRALQENGRRILDEETRQAKAQFMQELHGRKQRLIVDLSEVGRILEEGLDRAVEEEKVSRQWSGGDLGWVPYGPGVPESMLKEQQKLWDTLSRYPARSDVKGQARDQSRRLRRSTMQVPSGSMPIPITPSSRDDGGPQAHRRRVRFDLGEQNGIEKRDYEGGRGEDDVAEDSSPADHRSVSVMRARIPDRHEFWKPPSEHLPSSYPLEGIGSSESTPLWRNFEHSIRRDALNQMTNGSRLPLIDPIERSRSTPNASVDQDPAFVPRTDEYWQPGRAPSDSKGAGWISPESDYLHFPLHSTSNRTRTELKTADLSPPTNLSHRGTEPSSGSHKPQFWYPEGSNPPKRESMDYSHRRRVNSDPSLPPSNLVNVASIKFPVAEQAPSRPESSRQGKRGPEFETVAQSTVPHMRSGRGNEALQSSANTTRSATYRRPTVESVDSSESDSETWVYNVTTSSVESDEPGVVLERERTPYSHIPEPQTETREQQESAEAERSEATTSDDRTSTRKDSGKPVPSAWKATPSGPGGFTPSNSSSSESDWRKRQEEQAEKQRERFRQESLKREQEKQTKDAETDRKELFVRAWEKYELAWTALSNNTILRFRMIPWPVLMIPSKTDELTPDAIGTFMLSSVQSQESKMDRLKEQSARWQPDHFHKRWLAKVDVAEKEVVKRGVLQVVKALNELMVREREKMVEQKEEELRRRDSTLNEREEALQRLEELMMRRRENELWRREEELRKHNEALRIKEEVLWQREEMLKRRLRSMGRNDDAKRQQAGEEYVG